MSYVTSFGIVGIDPGANGAICLIPAYITPRNLDRSKTVVWKLNSSKLGDCEEAIRRAMTEAYYQYDCVQVCLEEEHPSPVMGVTNAGTFMAGYGFILGFLRGLYPAVVDPEQFVLSTVPPQKWQRGLPRDENEEIKDAWWKIAKEKFLPEVPKYAADAVLLAHYLNQLVFFSPEERASLDNPWCYNVL